MQEMNENQPKRNLNEDSKNPTSFVGMYDRPQRFNWIPVLAIAIVLIILAVVLIMFLT
jgi:hypothetical protein